MKKAIAFFLVLLIVPSVLCSCNNLWPDLHPGNQPMTKWEGDGVELYISSGIDPDILIVTDGEQKYSFISEFGLNFYAALYLSDRRETAPTEEPSFSMIGDAPEWRPVATYYVHVRPNGTCRLTLEFNYSSFFDGILPEEVILKKTADGLTPEDFPQFPFYENYAYCPIYDYDRNVIWVSSDGRMTLDADPPPYVTLHEEEGTILRVRFVDFDDMVYAGRCTDEFDLYLPFSAMHEHWQCEYFEDHFVVTIIQSEYYEVGETVTFTKVKAPAEPSE